jgi:hypothetical protein
MEDGYQFNYHRVHSSVGPYEADEPQVYGKRLVLPMAYGMNQAQFLHGAPVVKYDTVDMHEVVSGCDGEFVLLDTVGNQPAVAAPATVDGFRDRKNGSAEFPRSTAEGFWQIRIVNDYDTGGGVMQGRYEVRRYTDGTYSTGVVEGIDWQLMGQVNHVHDGDGNYLFSVQLNQGSVTNWGLSNKVRFEIVEPEYTTALNNWSENTTGGTTASRAYEGAPGSDWFQNGMMYDTGRGATSSHLTGNGSDSIYDLNLVGFVFHLRNYAESGSNGIRVAPIQKWSESPVIAAGSGWPFALANQSFRLDESTTDLSLAWPNTVLLFRGPGYIRGLWRTGDGSGGYMQAGNDNVTFHGKIDCYQDVTEYEMPVALLGGNGASVDSSGSANSYVYGPFWQTVDGDDSLQANGQQWGCSMVGPTATMDGTDFNWTTDQLMRKSRDRFYPDPSAARVNGVQTALIFQTSSDGTAVRPYFPAFEDYANDGILESVYSPNGAGVKSAGTPLYKMIGPTSLDTVSWDYELFHSMDHRFNYDTDLPGDPNYSGEYVADTPDPDMKAMYGRLPGIKMTPTYQQGPTSSLVKRSSGDTFTLEFRGREAEYQVVMGTTFGSGPAGVPRNNAYTGYHVVAFAMSAI